MENRPLLVILLVIFTVLVFTGCGPAPVSSSLTEVDSRFREFYNLQGGEETLGKPVTPAYIKDGKVYQVFENGMMVYKPDEPTGEKFGFEPLALQFGIGDKPHEAYQNVTGHYLNGHLIFDEFHPVFVRMGGLRFVGNPITEVRKNEEESRYEQYFENLGFYRLFSDPPGTVHLLPYGLIECQRNPSLACNGTFENAMPRDDYPQPFLPILNRLGENLTGRPLSDVYLAPDNRLEQIYENVVVYIDPDNPRSIGLRPLPEMVGIMRHPLSVEKKQDQVSFWPVRDGLGHNVPILFVEYIIRHGGSELSGDPITELFEINGLRRQCFLHYCLDFNALAPKESMIRPTALGYAYLQLQGFTSPDLKISVWESQPVLSPGQAQVIGVMLYNKTPSAPLQDVQPVLTLRANGKPPVTFDLPPTSVSGTSFLSLPASELPGLVEYEVCVSWLGSEPVCVKDSWIVK